MQGNGYMQLARVIEKLWSSIFDNFLFSETDYMRTKDLLQTALSEKTMWYAWNPIFWRTSSIEPFVWKLVNLYMDRRTINDQQNFKAFHR